MPLADLVPTIDDRTFADLVAEARTRIPRYTPEWTDLNESDPGMALVELFGWMTELLVYRLGKVPQLNYLKFLELIGFELTPAAPAIGEVTFPVQPSYSLPYVIVPQATQISTDTPDAGGPIVFETDRALIALTAQLDAVQVFEAPLYRDMSVANASASTGFDAFGPVATPGSALLLGFSSALAFPAVEIELAFFTQSKLGAAPLQCTGGVAPTLLPAQLAWEYWTGTSWLGLSLIDDETIALTRDGHVRVKAPPAGAMALATMGAITDNLRYWIRARLVQTSYQLPPRLLAVRTNTASVTQAQTISLEILGGSDGTPQQTFTTSGSPILAGTLQLVVDEGDGFAPWIEVPDFFGSGPDDLHYLLDRSTGTVRFGDGVHGRIPVANASNPDNVQATQYRIGGGARGNVNAGGIDSLMVGLPGVSAADVANLFATGGGGDEESLADAQIRAVGTLRTRDRAVTPEDFERLAVESGAVARAKALALYHPDFPGVQVPGVVSVVVVPNVPAPEPMPNPVTLSAVCRYLDARRLLTTELYVLPPVYHVITIRVTLIVEDSADLAAVQQAAQASIESYFDPLTGGEESSASTPGPGWPFGGAIYYSRVMRRLLVDGVQRVGAISLQLDDTVAPACSDVPIEAVALLANGAHEINVNYDVESAE